MHCCFCSVVSGVLGGPGFRPVAPRTCLRLGTGAGATGVPVPVGVGCRTVPCAAAGAAAGVLESLTIYVPLPRNGVLVLLRSWPSRRDFAVLANSSSPEYTYASLLIFRCTVTLTRYAYPSRPYSPVPVAASLILCGSPICS